MSSLAWSRFRGDFGPAATARSVQVMTWTVEFGGSSSITLRAASLARSSRVFAPSRAFMLYDRSMTKTASTASPRLPAVTDEHSDRPGQGHGQQDHDEDAEQQEDEFLELQPAAGLLDGEAEELHGPPGDRPVPRAVEEVQDQRDPRRHAADQHQGGQKDIHVARHAKSLPHLQPRHQVLRQRAARAACVVSIRT